MAISLQSLLVLVTVGHVIVGSSPETVQYACHHPNCVCREVPGNRKIQQYELFCRVPKTNGPSMPERNYSINIVYLSIVCVDNHNPIQLLNDIFPDLKYVLSLTLDGCRISMEPLIRAGNFYNLQRLVLKRTNISSISTKVKQLPLTSLEIVDGRLHQAPSICGLKYLNFLNISHNQISDLEPVSNNCTESDLPSNLLTVDASNNMIRSPLTWLNKSICTQLSTLNLGFNHLSSITPTELRNLAKLSDLDLSHNHIKELSSEAFSNKQYLSKLNLSHNAIDNFPRELFDNLHGLSSLDVSHNQIQNISGDLFSHLENVMLLNIGYNKLRFVPKQVLDSLSSVVSLILRDNHLTSVPRLLSGNVSELQILDLKNNRIDTLDVSSFSGLNKLVGISLRNNSLKQIFLPTFDVSPNLYLLDFSNNQIELLIDSDRTGSAKYQLPNLGNVEYLRLDINRLPVIRPVKRHFNKLKYFFVDNNELDAVTSEDLPDSLHTVTLSENRLRFLGHHTFLKMANLTTVTMQGNYPTLTKLRRSWLQISPKLNPKPSFFIGSNLFFCDCQMAFLKAWSIAGKTAYGLYHFLPNFQDLNFVKCLTQYDLNPTPIRQIPLSHFMCEFIGRRFCNYECLCCGQFGCACDYQCPDRCTCYTAGTYEVDFYIRIHCDNRSLSRVPNSVPKISNYLYLHGNNIPVLETDSFANLSSLTYLFLNSSGIATIQNGTFSGLTALMKLYLDHNQITELSRGTFDGLTSLKELYLHDNRIVYIAGEAFDGLDGLRSVSLSDNLLQTLSADVFPDFVKPSLISLSGNPWSCYCNLITDMLNFLNINGPSVIDVNQLYCRWPEDTKSPTRTKTIYIEGNVLNLKSLLKNSSSVSILEYNYGKLCSDNVTVINKTFADIHYIADNRNLVALTSLVAIVAVFSSLAAIVYLKWSEVQVILYIKFGLRLFNENKNTDERGRTYDAFVSYSSKDEHLVVHEIAPRLEKGKRKYKLCLHYRDFPVGASIADTIIESIEASKRTIMLISENFLSSEWCRYEFQTAHHHVLKESSHRLILVLLHDIDFEKLDPDLKVQLKCGHYLLYNDPWFWKKLYFSLPDLETPQC